jgi:transcriptional regulator with XRE-family HTH domain
MPQWPGLGDRIKQRLVELGYTQANGKPDILGFSLKHFYTATYMYKWLNAGVMPSRETIERLAKDLNVSPSWLLFGDDVDKCPCWALPIA